jgi:hypothetical protein
LLPIGRFWNVSKIRRSPLRVSISDPKSSRKDAV